MSFKRIIVTFIFIFTTVNAYNILVIYPTASYSHQIGQQAISQGLLSKGHHVTIISPNEFKSKNPNVTQINVEFLYKTVKKLEAEISKGMNTLVLLGHLSDFMPNMLDELLSNKEVRTTINKENYYDAVLVENLAYTPIFAVAEKLNLPLIGFVTTQMFPASHRAMGNPIHPTMHPPGVEPVPKNPTFLERCKLLYVTIVLDVWFYYSLVPAMDWVIQKHFDIKSNSIQLLERVDFAIEGFATELENTRPLLPNTIQIGFMHVKKPKPLPTNLQKYLDQSSNGVVYVSFGSNVKSALLDLNILATLKKVFKNLKNDVLWKFENDTMDDKPKNVRIEKWMPQQDVLAHKNIKLFITQGGQQSLEESVQREIPLLVIPFLTDQAANAAKVETLGIGLSLNPEDITTETLSSKIIEIIDNPRYKSTVQSLAKRVNDRPMSPVDTAVWWIEYVIRNREAAHLKYAGTKMSFIEYYLIDIIFFHLTIALIVVFIVYKLVQAGIQFFVRKTQKPMDKKKKR